MQDRNLVLVVDDDSGILGGLERLLKQQGYESILFSSAGAFKNHTDFESAACVIFDINLNDGSGIELRQGLKAAAALDSGCIAFLTKPFSAQSLIESLKKASAGRS